MEIKNYLDQVLDLPKMASDKLPFNHWNSCMNDSEKSIGSWINTLLKVGALAIILAGLWSIVKGFEEVGDKFSDGVEVGIGFIVGAAFWAYALIPISNVVRDLGAEIASSTGNMLQFVVKDLPLALIRAAGYIAALLALFSAVAMTVQWLTALELGGAEVYGMIAGALNGFGAFLMLGFVALDALIAAVTDEAMIIPLLEDMFEFDNGFFVLIDPADVDWFDFDQLGQVIGAYIKVISILIFLFVNIILYKWVYSLGSTFVKWISSPYLPFKQL